MKGKETNEKEQEEEENGEHRDARRNENKLWRKLKMAADVIEGNSVQQQPQCPPPAPPKNNPPVIITDGKIYVYARVVIRL